MHQPPKVTSGNARATSALKGKLTRIHQASATKIMIVYVTGVETEGRLK